MSPAMFMFNELSKSDFIVGFCLPVLARSFKKINVLQKSFKYFTWS